MFSPENNLTEEQSEALNNFITQFDALRESIPAQLEALSNNLNNVEATMHERFQSDINHVLSQAENGIKVLGEEIKTFIDNHVVLKDDLPEPEARITNNTPASHAPLIKVKEPVPFSGRSSQCHAFFSQLTLVFASNPLRFQSDKNKILYAISYMQGVVFAFMEPYLSEIDSNDPPEILTNFEHFKETITTAFGDSDPITSSEHVLRSLKQTGSVAAYATEFRRLSMSLKWNDIALCSQFKLNLKSFVIEELARRPAAKDLTSLMTMAIEIDNFFFTVHRRTQHANNNGNQPRLMSHRNPLNNRNHFNNSNNQTSLNQRTHYPNNNYASKHSNDYKSQRNYNPRTNHSNHSNSSSNTSKMGNFFSSNNSTPNASSAASPMELGAINVYKPLSAPVKEFRKANGLCLYCGEANHQVANCPNKGRPATNSLGTIVQEEMLYSRIQGGPDSDLMVDSRPSMMSSSVYPLNAIQATTRSRHQSLMILPITVYYGENEELIAPSEAMIDSGASSNFVSRQLVDTLQLEMLRCPLGEEVLFRLANNSVYVSKHTVILPIRITNTMHEELLTLRVIETASFSLIFGMPWLRRHCPKLHFDTMQVQMSCIENGRCFPVRFDSASTHQDTWDSLSTVPNNVLNDNTSATEVASTIMEAPAALPTLEPTADPFFGHIRAETFQLPFIELPPIDFVNTLTHIQAQLTDNLHTQQGALDDWMEEQAGLQWPHQDDSFQQNNNENWGENAAAAILEGLNDPFMTREDERSVYELQHPKERINQQVISTILQLDTPPHSIHSWVDEPEVEQGDPEVVDLVTPPTTPPLNAIASNEIDNVEFIDMNNTIVDNYSLCLPLCPMIDNESVYAFIRKIHTNHSLSKSKPLPSVDDMSSKPVLSINKDDKTIIDDSSTSADLDRSNYTTDVVTTDDNTTAVEPNELSTFIVDKDNFDNNVECNVDLKNPRHYSTVPRSISTHLPVINTTLRTDNMLNKNDVTDNSTNQTPSTDVSTTNILCEDIGNRDISVEKRGEKRGDCKKAPRVKIFSTRSNKNDDVQAPSVDRTTAGKRKPNYITPLTKSDYPTSYLRSTITPFDMSINPKYSGTTDQCQLKTHPIKEPLPSHPIKNDLSTRLVNVIDEKYHSLQESEQFYNENHHSLQEFEQFDNKNYHSLQDLEQFHSENHHSLQGFNHSHSKNHRSLQESEQFCHKNADFHHETLKNAHNSMKMALDSLENAQNWLEMTLIGQNSTSDNFSGRKNTETPTQKMDRNSDNKNYFFDKKNLKNISQLETPSANIFTQKSKHLA